ncbi:PAS domain-containing protein [Allomuricauda sp. d1]|uniref:PAS domain-containing sensor histidine kinase n=1 Tax=Allomuricauda sp. d1 TaxID=3136725 RepID=UPI0031E277C0
MRNFVDLGIEQREVMLEKALSVARIGFWEVDLTNNKVTWSRITKEIHEVPDDYIPNLEEGVNFYKEGKYREEISRLVQTAMEKGVPWDTELIIVTTTGNEVWVRAKGEVEIVDGKPVRLFGTFQDIDEKKRAQIKYNEASKRLALATNEAKIGIWDYNVVDNILVWDDNMFKLYGLKKTDFSGVVEAWESSIHPDDKERSQHEVELALKGEKEFDTEFRIIKPNGEVNHIKAHATVQRDSSGNPLKMIGINHDITVLKNTRLELLRSQESLAGAFENSSVGMALVGLDGKWIQVNNSVCNSLGYTIEELMQLTFQDITHPDDLQKDLQLLQELIDGKRDSYQIEKRYYHKKGYLVYVLLTVTGVYNVDGSLSHFISQIVDITSRIEAEEKQQKLNEITMEQNKNLLNFAHIVSHNLRSHSTNMSMLIDFLNKEKNSSEKEKIMGMLKSASNGLNETVTHLNEVVQIKTTALQLMKTVNLVQAVKDAKNNIQALIGEKNAQIDVDVSTDHVVKAVPAYLDSILLNLFTNALKYSSPERTPLLRITSKACDKRIVLEFKDNGLGIDLERHGDKIFGMFKTFHRHKDAKGIGLFITKNQIEAMGGNISVESKVDKGATFKLDFERAKKVEH